MIIVVVILTFIGITYFFSLALIAFGFYQKSIKKEDVPLKEIEFISVIVPVRNEQDNITTCVESFVKQDFPKDKFELLIVDDHSEDNTTTLIKELISAHKEINIQLLSLNKSSSKKAALQLGKENAKGKIIASTDADCLVPVSWLRQINAEFTNNSDMVLGPVMFNDGTGFLVNFQVLDMMAIQGLTFGAMFYNSAILNNAANLAYTKKSLERVNGYDDYNTPSGDDVFLLQKFKKNNYSIQGLLARTFIVKTKSERSYKKLVQQRLRWSSKSRFYKDTVLIYFSALILLQNFSMIFIYAALPFVEKYEGILAILLFSKWLIDFILLLLVAFFFKRKKALLYFIPVQIVYPIYIIFIWMGSLTNQFEWKGRKFNG